MESTSSPNHERPVLLVIADVSGYTRFAREQRHSWAHGQYIISELIGSVLREVDMPLEIAKLQGDAVFLYASRDESDATWDEHRRVIGAKLLAFFDAFRRRLRELEAANLCHCDACQGIAALRLKVIVHYGAALFYRIDRFTELSGLDVILVHRLTKNSVRGDEYLLLTAAAAHELPFLGEMEFSAHREDYENLGPVEALVHYPGGAPAPLPTASLPVRIAQDLRKIGFSWKLMLRRPAETSREA